MVELDGFAGKLKKGTDTCIYKFFDEEGVEPSGGKTAFYISHRLSSCKFCDKIAVFSEGKIAEYGNHEELAAIPNGIYAEMFEAQAQYYR